MSGSGEGSVLQTPGPEPTRAASRDRWRILGVVLLVQVMISSVTQSVFVLTPWLSAELGLSLAEAASLGTAVYVATALSVAAAGWAIDAWGERAGHVAGSLIVGLAAASFALLPFGPLAFIPLVLAGVGAAVPTPGGSRAVMVWFPPGQRGLAMGIRQTGIPLGGGAAAALAQLAAVAGGWRVAILVGAVACLLVSLACWVAYPRESPRRVAAVTRGGSSRPTGGSWRNLVTRDIALVSVAGALLPVAQFSLITYLALSLNQTQGLPLATGAMLLLAAQLTGAVGRIVWGVWSDRGFAGRRRPPLAAACLLATAGTLTLGWLPPGVPLWLLAAIAIGLGFGAIGWQGTWVSLLSELAHPAYQGRTVGLGLTVVYAGIAAGPPLAGLLKDLTGSWTIVWSVIAAVLAAGALALVPVREGPGRWKA